MSRRLPRVRTLTGLAVTGALAFAGVAIADHGSASTQAVSATFTATTVTGQRTGTCTGADGTYEVTNATYSGTSTSSDARLNGPIELRVRSIYNTSENVGWLDARVKVTGGTSGARAQGTLRAVNGSGQLQGYLTGNAHGPNGRLLATVSAVFTSVSGFTSGQLGTGSGINTAIVVSGNCKVPKPPKPPKPLKKAKKAKHPKHSEH